MPIADRHFIGTVILLIAALAVGVVIAASAAPAHASPAPQETEKYCLGCHAKPDIQMTLPSGEVVSVQVSPDDLAHSVHSPLGIECAACHTEITTYPHPSVDFADRREMTLDYSDRCQRCHSAQFEKTHDSIHYQISQAGNRSAPVCADCHGAHNIRPPDEPRALISVTCGKCHEQIAGEYRESVHGGALVAEDNPDVPVCTDCHGVHNIQDPRTPQFEVHTPDLCAGCHANSEMMNRYGLSSDVYQLYGTSWHGLDLAVYRTRWPTGWHETAICTDCHGVHAILSAKNPASQTHPDHLLATCRKCHPNVGPNWTSAWVGHNRIEARRTPILFYTEAFYSSLTPLVLWASIIYVILQALHALVDRIRRSMP